MPLRTAVQIGADEGFELAKATSCLHGYKLYSQIWNDQPPLHTFLVTEMLKYLGPRVLGARLVTVSFGAILLASFFLLTTRYSGLLGGIIAILLLISSPGFIELTGSCMLEIPSISCAILGLSLLSLPVSERQDRVRHLRLPCVIAGLTFACSLEMKLLPAYLLPVAAFLILTQCSKTNGNAKQTNSKRVTLALALFGSVVILGIILIDFVTVRGSYLAYFGQSWRAHFTAPKSLDIGSPDEHPFDWSLLWKHWDASLPAIVVIGAAIVGLCWPAGNSKIQNPKSKKISNRGIPSRFTLNPQTVGVLLPVGWFIYALGIFAFHRPWWAYYYVHIALPLCWCGAIGITRIATATRDRFRLSTIGSALSAISALMMVAALSWACARVYFQIKDARALPKTFSTPVINRIVRFEPIAHFLYADESVYSFHTGIPMPPDLAVVSLKRFWAGDMTTERLISDLANSRPEIILLANDSKPVIFQQLLDSNYRLIYFDNSHRLFLRKDIKRSP